MGLTSKKLETIENIKKEIKTRKPDSCACRLYKVYIERVEFFKLYTA